MSKTQNRAEKFRTLAQSLQPKIDYYLKPAIASMTMTPRRSNIAASMQSEGLRLEEIQRWLFGMADAIEKGVLPSTLNGISNRCHLELLQGFEKSDLDSLFSDSRWEQERKKLTALNLTTVDDIRAALNSLKELATATAIDPALLKIQELERALIGQQLPGFFPTPDNIARLLVEEAEIEQGTHCLEPSAGIGNLALAAQEIGALVDCIELRPKLVEILKLKGLSVREGDFLNIEPEDTYGAIVMNPPFGKGQDALHIQRAYEWLADSGKLVAIASNSITFSDRHRDFRNWLQGLGAKVEPLPALAFLTGFRPTSVRTLKITLTK